MRRESWPIAGTTGVIAAFRPWDWPDDSPLPPASPVRNSPAVSLSDDGGRRFSPLDLLKVIAPAIDRVQGIWFFDHDKLRTPLEFNARMQVPVALPKSYTMRMTVERLQGKKQFGIGIAVGGRATMISIDNSDSRFVGLDRLDGKPAADNESTKAGTFLPLHKPVELACRVSENEVRLNLDKKEALRWQGNPDRLSITPDYAVPHTDWPFLSAFDSEFEVSSFRLEPGN